MIRHADGFVQVALGGQDPALDSDRRVMNIRIFRDALDPFPDLIRGQGTLLEGVAEKGALSIVGIDEMLDEREDITVCKL